MGRPYQQELNKIENTYNWAMSLDISKLKETIKSSLHLPLVAVGSGGSLTAAEVMVTCHQTYFKGLARSTTPLELISCLPSNGNVAVWFFSASGKNVDIQNAFKHSLLCEPKSISAMIGRVKSPIAKLCSAYQYANIFECELPAGRDGFLATNSLLAFSVLIVRAYQELNIKQEKLPANYKDLVKMCMPISFESNQLEADSKDVLSRSVLHVLYGNDLKSAAIDLESKFIEAGLQSVHLADFRNFAHGRHHWFAKNAKNSSIIALSTFSDATLAENTIKLIPSEIPQLHISIKADGGKASVVGIILSLYLTGYLGKIRGIDPGKPGVPSFGSRIYNLKTNAGFRKKVSTVEMAIRRKTGCSIDQLTGQRRKNWESAYGEFLGRLENVSFRGIVLDYDGTVVDTRDRFNPPSDVVAKEIIRLLKSGIHIGFATGRGKSIHKDLRNFIPESLWPLILVGYYNGAELLFLNDLTLPDGSEEPIKALEFSLRKLTENLEISSLAKVESRKHQLTVTSHHFIPEGYLWDLAQNELWSNENAGNIFRSSHSIDVVGRDVTKYSVIKKMMGLVGKESNILCIGDRGRWPGNDAALLSHTFSLSVDEVSPSFATCWNIAPAGIRGPQALLYYLRNLRIKVGRKNAPTASFNGLEDKK